MARSQGAPNPGLITRILYFFAKRALGHVPLGMRIRAFDPKLVKLGVRMDLYAASKGVVPMHLKELAQLKTALMIGCPF